jgi:hypothetical protein
MGSIDGIRSVAPAAGRKSPGQARSQAEADAGPLRPPVVPVEAASSGRRPVSQRPMAAFLTHLIATAHDAPQTRRHRRAALTDAVSAYAATAALIEGGQARRAFAGGGRAA